MVRCVRSNRHFATASCTGTRDPAAFLSSVVHDQNVQRARTVHLECIGVWRFPRRYCCGKKYELLMSMTGPAPAIFVVYQHSFNFGVAWLYTNLLLHLKSLLPPVTVVAYHIQILSSLRLQSAISA